MLVFSFYIKYNVCEGYVVKYIKDVSEVPIEIKGMKVLTMSGWKIPPS